MKFSERQLWTDGHHFSYIDEGKPGGVPIIFIHGFPLNKWMWENQVEVCMENHRAIAFDVRGHGNSKSGTEGFSIANLAEDLFLFMDALQIEKAQICGLSMGGYIALNAIRQHPERIAALVLCDTQCRADSERVRMKRMQAIDALRANGLAAYASESLPKLFSAHTIAAKKNVVAFIERTILNTHVEAICHTLIALAGRNETCSVLPSIAIPALIMVGESDELTSPKAAQYMHERIPGSVLQVIDNAGHLSNLENPMNFNIRLQWFLGLVSGVSHQSNWSDSLHQARR
jgi:3-oxoadipate enol-lactonase